MTVPGKRGLHGSVRLRSRLQGRRLTTEVVDLEDGRPALGRRALQFGRVNLEEALLFEVLAEEETNATLDAEDSVVCGSLRKEVSLLPFQAVDGLTRRSNGRDRSRVFSSTLANSGFCVGYRSDMTVAVTSSTDRFQFGSGP